MATFASAVANQTTLTENGMPTRVGSADALTDLFFKIGAMRNQNVLPPFVAAYAEDKELAIRIALWVRDIRSGAGERKTFRSILRYLSDNDEEMAIRVVNQTPRLGRWDDLFSTTGKSRNAAFALIKTALDNKDGLCAKWMPRKGVDAEALRSYLKLPPKKYRKLLVGLSSTVETQMCAKEWASINYSHIPSVAAARYQKAFNKRDPERYKEYRDALVKNDGTVKINASAVYPYDIIRSMRSGDQVVAQAQWDALPNYMGEDSILAMVDTSGSMTCSASGSISCLDGAVSLGLYLADKNKGAFKDTFLTFSGTPQLVTLKGTLRQKITQMNDSTWAMNTNIEAAFLKILSVAKNGNVSQDEMPKKILILSDMQFDSCTRNPSQSAMAMIESQYQEAGYEVPQIIFWNLSNSNGVPVEFDKSGTALISGFSPSILKSVLKAEDMTPRAVMLKTIMADTYNF